MFYQIFLAPHVKQWAFVTYKHGIYELPPAGGGSAHTRKKRRRRILGNMEISEKCLNSIE